MGRRAKLQLSVPQLFNEAQRVSSDTGRKRYAGVFWELCAEDAEGTFEQLLACVKWLLMEAEKSTYTDRLLLPGGFVSVLVSQVQDEDQLQLVEVLIEQLIDAADAEEHTVRWRACQLLQSIVTRVPDTLDLSIQTAEELQAAMLARLDDAKPAVRAAAARALKRLPIPGEDGDFDECPVTQALLDLLAGDKNKDVRKAVVASLPLLKAGTGVPQASLCTIPVVLGRTLDESDEVRKVTYVALKDLPMEALRPHDRLMVLQRGLHDRTPAVAAAASDLLKHWLEKGCENDVLTLLSLLDVEQHTDEAISVVRALMACGTLNAVDLCNQAAEAWAGLRRDFSRDEGVLLSSAEALLWRVLCEELCDDATSKGLAAANAKGTAATIEAAAAGERYAALENALPASAEDMVNLIQLHASAGEQHRFATCQLMLLAGICMDFADATSRKAAATVLQNLLKQLPSEDDITDATRSQLGAPSWQQALGSFLRKVHGDPVELAAALLTAVGQLVIAVEQAGDRGGAAAWLQTLRTTALLLDLLPDARPALRADAAFTLDDVLHRAIQPVLHHDDLLVRREAVRCLGLYCLLDYNDTPLSAPLGALRAALIGWKPAGDTAEVASVAAEALGDLALRKGIKQLDRYLMSSPAAEEANPALDPELSQQPLLDVFLGMLQLWENCLERLGKGKRTKAGQAGLEATLELGAALVEALARLVLHNNVINLYDASMPLGLEDAEVLKVLVRLLILNFDPAAGPATRLRQCLPVFFETYAAMTPPPGQPFSQEYLSTVLLQAAHCAAQREMAAGKRITAAKCMSAKVLRFVTQLLEMPIQGPNGEMQMQGHEELAKVVLAEVNDCCNLAVPKPYLAALCKLPSRLPVNPDNQATIRQVRGLAQRARGLLTDRLLHKDLETVVEHFSKLERTPAEPLDEEDLAVLLENIRQQIAEADGDYKELPFQAAEAGAPATVRAPNRNAAHGKTPATRAGRGKGRAAQPSSSSEDEEGSDVDEAAQEPQRRPSSMAAPTTATRRMPARSTRTTRNLAEQQEDSSSHPEGDSSTEDSQDEDEGGSENVYAAHRGKGTRRTSADSVSALRQALRENRISSPKKR